MFTVKFNIMNMEEVKKDLSGALERWKESISPIVAQIMQEEMQKLSKFPISVSINEDGTMAVGPVVRTEKELEEAIDEATKGTSPQFATKFKFRNRSWLINSLRLRGVKGIK